MNIIRKQPGPRMSEAVIAGDLIFLAGQVSEKAEANVTTQTQDILDQIDALLAECGSDKAHIVSATIYLADIGTFNDMNAAWDAWVDKANPPARATIEAKLAFPSFKVEISIVAAKKG